MMAALKATRKFLPGLIVVLAVVWVFSSCGGGGGGGGGDGGGGGTTPVEQEVLTGAVFDGYIEAALVCADSNGNGRCDQGEAQARTGTGGKYELTVPKGYGGPLAAEVTAGQSKDSDEPSGTVDRSYRMASPARTYSTNITPYSTLVRLTGESDFSVAEMLVRNELGLPPRFDIKPASPPSAGSYAQGVARAVVSALKATTGTLDHSAPGALAQVVAALPVELTVLPTLRIETKDAAPIVSKEIYVDATFSLANPPAAAVPFALNGKIRGRGHSTWGQPKSPYKIQFKEDASFAALPDVLGMPKNRNWALLADWFDRSLLRNKLAFSLGNSSAFSDGMAWNPSGQHVEVTLNGDYIGVYLLTQDIRLASDRVDLKKMSSSATVNDVDGGYIVEVDWHWDCVEAGVFDLRYRSARGVPFCVDTPDEDAITPAQLAYIKQLLGAVELDVYAGSSLDRIDAASFADWYLLNELFRNNDAQFWSSVFMWKDTDAAADPRHRRLNLGPIWDFDLAAGNVNYNNNWLVEGCWVAGRTNPNWIAQLLDHPDFLDLTIARWKSKRPVLEKLVAASIDAYARRLEAAQQRNFVRWPIIGVQLVNYYKLGSYAEEVAFLKSFLLQRMAWLDQALATPDSFNGMCREATGGNQQ